MLNQNVVTLGNLSFSNDSSLILIGGLNVIESEAIALETAEEFVTVCRSLNIPCVFKASFDKANRSSVQSFRGIGMDAGLEVLATIKSKHNVPILTDVHLPEQVERVASVADILQLPAFLARQTDLIEALASTKSIVNIKKPQFLSPMQVVHIMNKFLEFGNDRLLVCERGTQFGYDNLVVDMLGFGVIKKTCGNAPVIFDVTHSLQVREQGQAASGGRRSQVLELARAGVATGLAGLFVETHPDPNNARCDGASALPLKHLEPFLTQIFELDELVKKFSALKIE